MEINIDAILAPIADENPGGENLRYTEVYENIKEARREDDPHDRGDWQHELKTAEWGTVVDLSVAALTEKSKDLQIAAWLTEALTKTDGFKGLETGLAILKEFLLAHWDHLYPEIEDDDLEFRAGPLEGLNEKLSVYIKEIPLTDPGKTPGYSWFDWQISRQVGYESDTVNQYGDVDQSKRETRDELIADGKITSEAFDEAVDSSAGSFHINLSQNLGKCLEGFDELDKAVDGKFGREAPRLAEIRTALEDIEKVVAKVLKDKKLNLPVADTDKAMPPEAAVSDNDSGTADPPAEAVPESAPTAPNLLTDTGSMEQKHWQEALNLLNSAGMQQALQLLYSASSSAQSTRDRNRYQLLMAKLCLRARRPDLALPIAERLNTLIEELQLERWESPIWIGDVIDTLYQCLTQANASDDDISRAKELLKKLCITDVTKAMSYNV